MIKAEGLVEVLEKFYNRDLERLVSNYSDLGNLDPELMSELGVEIENIKGGLKQKIENLKSFYWRELFNKLDTITDKLTSNSRDSMLKTLFENTQVDFTLSNCHSVVLWIIKNANKYFDSQLVSTFERMTEKANITLYKSNHKTFGREDWRYNNRPADRGTVTHYALEYRVILASIGGLSNGYSRFNGLSNSAMCFIQDLRTCATNLGFDTANIDISDLTWCSGKKNNIMYRDHKTNSFKILFEVKAFANGNLHIRFLPDFMIKLNIEFGRLMGWIRNPRQAAEELEISSEQSVKCFKSNFCIESNVNHFLLTAA